MLVDKMIARALLLPVGELRTGTDQTRTVRCFDENPELIAAKTKDNPVGPYHVSRALAMWVCTCTRRCSFFSVGR